MTMENKYFHVLYLLEPFSHPVVVTYTQLYVEFKHKR